MGVVNDERVKVYDFLKTYSRMCNKINNYVLVRPWFGDPDEEEQWGCGYRDDMIAQFKKDIYHKNFTLGDHGKDYEIDILENRNKFWLNFINNARGPVHDKLYDYDYNYEGVDETAHGAEIIPERRKIKKLLDLVKCKRLRKQLKNL